MPSDPTPWTPGPRRTLAKTRILTLHEQRFDCPDDPARGGDFTVIETNDWVNIVALTDPAEDPEGPRLILVEQYRYGVAENTLELVGGVVDADEDPLAAGPRELLEETGYAGDPPRVLGVVQANPAIMTNRATTLLILNCRRIAEQRLDPHEHIAVRLARVADVPSMVARGQIANAVVVAALFHHFVNGDGAARG